MHIHGAQVAGQPHQRIQVARGAVLAQALVQAGVRGCGAGRWAGGRLQGRHDRAAVGVFTAPMLRSRPAPPHLQQHGLCHQEAGHEGQRPRHVTLLQVQARGLRLLGAPAVGARREQQAHRVAPLPAQQRLPDPAAKGWVGGRG